MATIVAKAIAGLLLWTGTVGAQRSNLSGTWILNAERSRWSRMQQPQRIVVEIDHKEPALRYCGTVTYANEEDRDFCFDGAVDGRGYVVERSYGHGNMTMKRLDAFSVLSTYRSDDGQYLETSITTVSRDGKRLTRRMRLTCPLGSRTWIEEYEKR